MNLTRTSLAVVATLLLVGFTSVEAKETRSTRQTVQLPSYAMTPGGGVKDTCNESSGSDASTCDPDALAARCDAAGGGMSTEPGGGVDCDLGPE